MWRTTTVRSGPCPPRSLQRDACACLRREIDLAASFRRKHGSRRRVGAWNPRFANRVRWRPLQLSRGRWKTVRKPSERRFVGCTFTGF